MDIETTQGPSALVGPDGDDNGGGGGEDDSNDDEDDDDDVGEEDSYIDSETENSKLRTYELNRLRLATKDRDTFADFHLIYFCFCLGLVEKILNEIFKQIYSIMFSC
jgi:hypothetical protein